MITTPAGHPEIPSTQVTLGISAKNGTDVGVSRHPPVFCDWLKIRAPASLESVEFERYLSCYTADGETWRRDAWTELRDARREGDIRKSDSTLVRIRWSPEHEHVTVDGNLGRFGRRDNVFGLGVYAAGWRFLDYMADMHRLNLKGEPELRRVDLTANIAFRDTRDAYAYIQWTQGVRLGKAVYPNPYPTGTQWQTENWSAKVYDKLADLRRHKLHDLADEIQAQEGYLLRLELTLRTDELQRHNLTTLAAWRNREDAMNIIFTDRFKPLLRPGVAMDETLASMPNRLSNAVEAWRNGRNFEAAVADKTLSRRTYYRLKKELLGYGIDISIPCNVTRLNIRPREVEWRYVDEPEWYRERVA